MLSLIQRNLKLFFRNRAGVFFLTFGSINFIRAVCYILEGKHA